MLYNKNILLLIGLAIVFIIACSQSPAAQFVIDKAQILTFEQRDSLESKLVEFSNTNGTQIVVLTQTGITENLNHYCTNIMETWGIGQADRNNGVLLFIDPQERNTYLATGTGTEVWLPDTLAKRIIDNQLIPAFKVGDYHKGIVDATDFIMDLADKAYPNGK